MEQETQLVKYKCPTCGEYNEPYMHDTSGKAYCLCSSCNSQYVTLPKRNANFRRFCQRVSRKNTLAQSSYSKQELKIKEFLEKLGFREGLDFIHNARVKSPTGYYWLDFYLPKKDLVIEYSPDVWHSLDNRKKSDERKLRFLEENNLDVIIIRDLDDLKTLTNLLKEG